jgi:hypothetical protein
MIPKGRQSSGRNIRTLSDALQDYRARPAALLRAGDSETGSEVQVRVWNFLSGRFKVERL